MKVGDEVEVLGGKFIDGFYYNPREMDCLVGQIRKIIDISSEGRHFIEGDRHYWHESWLKLKEEAMWDDKTVEAIKKSVVHWEENVRKLENGEILDEDDYKGGTCSLCKKFAIPTSCSIGDCPLKLRKMKCGDDNTPWDNFNENNTVENARNMVLALKSLFYPEPEKKEVFYSIGQRLENQSNGDEWQINLSGGSQVILNSRKGHRWKEAITVNDTDKITEEEFKQICGSGRFTLKKEYK